MILLRQSTTVPNTSKVRALIEAGSMALLRRACYDGRDGQGKRGPDDGSAVTLTTEATMIAMWVKVRIKPEMREKFLKAIEVDALGSERDEPGCLRFNVLQDEKDPNVYYFYEIYKDQAALEAHRNTPHYAVWRGVADVLDGPTEPTRCQTVFPAARPYWGKV
jgi:Uncharacterized conserved protein